MEIKKVKSVIEDLNTFDYLAKDGDYISVTEWQNGEGWDITFADKMMHLSMGELDAINYLVKKLEYEGKHKED